MEISLQEMIQDLISSPGLGMFAWMCFVFFLVAIVFFSWAIKSGQFKDLEKSKFDMFDDDGKEVKENGK